MIVNGRKLADEILIELKKEIKKLPRRLAVGAVLVGKNLASRPEIESGRGSPALQAAESFLKQKAKVAEFLGVDFKIFRYNPKIKTKELRKEILKISENPVKKNYTTSGRSSVNGIIIQLPLPKHIKTDSILNVINPQKDIDALSSAQIFRDKTKADKKNPKVLAPTVESVKYIFDKYRINYKNKNILIVGRGRLVGQPIYNWLTAQYSSRKLMRSEKKIKPDVKIKIIDVKQKNQLPKLAHKADIIISGVGKSGLIKGSIVKKDAVLIDFGFSRKNNPPNGEARKISGDFDFSSCAKKAKLITPVPGGMGPIMVAMLFKNLLTLTQLNK